MDKVKTLVSIDPKALSKVQSKKLSEEFVELMGNTFQALSDPTRVTILYALTNSSLCVRDIAILVGISESAISHQLRLLKDRKLVKAERKGNVIYYSVSYKHLSALLKEAEYLADHVKGNHDDHPN